MKIGDQLLVSVRCVNEEQEYAEEGSGCIIKSNSAEYDYVLTALHCLRGDDENPHEYNICDIQLFNRELNELKAIKTYENMKLDIVIIVIEKTILKKHVRLKSQYCDHINYISSYPSISQDGFKTNNDLISKEFKATFEKNELNKIILSIDTRIYSPNNDVTEALRGVSGSAIYGSENNQDFLIGIVTNVPTLKNPFGEVVGIDISEFRKLLTNSKLENFSEYIDNNLECYIERAFTFADNELIIRVLKNHADNIKSLEVIYFIDWLKHKMFLPYNEDNYNHDEVWIGWIKFLTFMQIASEENFIDPISMGFDKDKFLSYVNLCRNKNIKYFHAFNYKKLSEIVSIVYQDDEIRNDLEFGDKLVINFPINTHRKFAASKEISFIVDDIVKEKLFTNKRLMIDDPKVNKSVDFMHIDYIQDEIERNNECLCESKYINLVNKIKKTINEVLK